MTKYVLLLGCAPEDYRQKRLEETHGFLISEEGGLIPEQNIIILPNGTNELLLESTLNGIVDEQPDEACLYIFAKSAEDLTALSEYEAVGYGKLDVVRLGDEEIRKEIIEYYQGLFEKIGSSLKVFYEVCDEYVSEEELGYERV